MRAQAALEYLVTYGWGFLAILIMLAGLSYFGFLSPSKYLPERCDFGIQLSCVDFVLLEGDTSADGYVRIRFRNNFGDTINLTGNMWMRPGVTVQDAERGPPPGTALNTAGLEIAKGNTSDELYITLPNTVTDEYLLVEGTRGTVQMIVEFRRAAGGAPLHNVSGEVFATVQP